jgi:hypothetical protein
MEDCSKIQKATKILSTTPVYNDKKGFPPIRAKMGFVFVCAFYRKTFLLNNPLHQLFFAAFYESVHKYLAVLVSKEGTIEKILDL